MAIPFVAILFTNRKFNFVKDIDNSKKTEISRINYFIMNKIYRKSNSIVLKISSMIIDSTKLRKLRDKQKISQEELADVIELSQSTIAKYEKSYHHFPLFFLN